LLGVGNDMFIVPPVIILEVDHFWKNSILKLHSCIPAHAAGIGMMSCTQQHTVQTGLALFLSVVNPFQSAPPDTSFDPGRDNMRRRIHNCRSN